MSNSQRLYHTVTRAILAQCPTTRITQTRTLAWFIVGIVVTAHCQFTRIAPHLPWAGTRDGIVQRLRRVLMNQPLAVRTLYGPTVEYILRWLNVGQPLILVIAFAYVWLVNIGVAVVKRGLRYRVDRRARRTLSYFRLGWDWLKQLLAQDQILPKEDNYDIYGLHRLSHARQLALRLTSPRAFRTISTCRQIDNLPIDKRRRFLYIRL